MSYEWWIIGFLVYWLGLSFLLAHVNYADEIFTSHRRINILYLLMAILPLAVAARALQKTYRKYGPDRAMEKEDQ